MTACARCGKTTPTPEIWLGWQHLPSGDFACSPLCGWVIRNAWWYRKARATLQRARAVRLARRIERM